MNEQTAIGATVPSSCQRCKAGFGDHFYRQGPQTTICAACHQGLSAPFRLKGWEAFFRSLLAGGLAAVLTSLCAALIIVLSGRDFAIFWIIVASFIAWAIKKGSEDRGTAIFRLLALSSLYAAIGLSWLACLIFWAAFGFPKDDSGASDAKNMPFVGMLNPPPLTAPLATSTPEASSTPKAIATPKASATPEAGDPEFLRGLDTNTKAALGLIFLCVAPVVVVLGAPILVMWASPISILLYGLAMHRVWKATARESRDLSGPFSLSDLT